MSKSHSWKDLARIPKQIPVSLPFINSPSKPIASHSIKIYFSSLCLTQISPKSLSNLTLPIQMTTITPQKPGQIQITHMNSVLFIKLNWLICDTLDNEYRQKRLSPQEYLFNSDSFQDFLASLSESEKVKFLSIIF